MPPKNPQKPSPRAKPDGYMTSGEKSIWAAAYVAEYRYWMTASGGRTWEPWQAANFAIGRACEAVSAARGAVNGSHLENSVHQAFLRTMLKSTRT
jgi:hypothetical protein